SFQTAYPFGASRMDVFKRRPENAHNDYLELLYEIGPGAFFAFAFLALCLFGPHTRAAPAPRSVLIGFAACALVAFPSHLACSAYLAALCAGHLCRYRPSLRDEIRHWRMVLHERLARRASDRKHAAPEICGAGVPARAALSLSLRERGNSTGAA